MNILIFYTDGRHESIDQVRDIAEDYYGRVEVVTEHFREPRVIEKVAKIEILHVENRR